MEADGASGAEVFDCCAVRLRPRELEFLLGLEDRRGYPRQLSWCVRLGTSRHPRL